MSTPFIRRIGIVILESGIIYSVFLVVSIVMCLTNVPYRKIFVDMVNNIIPITFYLIILRLGQAHGIDPDCQGLESGLVFASAPTSAGLSQSCLSNHGMQSIVAGETKSVPVEPIPTQKGPTYTSHPPNVTRPGTSSSTTSASKQVSLDLVV
ncbi:hypothetical protein V5O48_006161 [Marasmius crinis-equi]|uniref:Uncharacterized protein n=1 Tax=Marasmius crinis-equi TaxID=585013 RepID=A0ABR3FKB4_9AGAR